LGSPLPTLAPLIETVAPAVVNISVSAPRPQLELGLEREFERLFRRRMPPQNLPEEIRSAGSGVIVDAAQGYIVTNHHVVEEATTILVTLNDNRGFEATVVGSDAASDIALLKIDSTELAQIGFGNSDSLRVGDYVVAIGNPFNFSNTVTAGIVSGLGRSGLDPDLNMYESFIQTDASINPGNSGGALVNLRGELVGINSAIISRSGGNVGIGFAIPVNMMRDVVDQLVAGDGVHRGYLGIQMSGLSLERSRELGLRDMAGAEITLVTEDSAAARAGLQADDVIVAIDDRRVLNPGSLRATVGLKRPGDEVEITVVRAGQERSLKAVLGEQPPALARSPALDGGMLDSRLAGSFIVDNLPDDAALGADVAPNGILIVIVAPSSPAAENGLLSGDVITHVNGTRITGIGTAAEALREADEVILELRRGNTPRIVITLN
jgi:Do/DeqQ family serine protease